MCRLQWHLMQVWFGVCSLHGAVTCRAWCYDIPIQLCHLCPSRHTATARGEQPCPVLWPWHWLGTAVFPHLSPIYPCHLEYWCHAGIPSMQETPWRLATGAGGLREQMEDLSLGVLRDCLVHYILLAWRPSIWHTEPGLAGLLLLRGHGKGHGNWELGEAFGFNICLKLSMHFELFSAALHHACCSPLPKSEYCRISSSCSSLYFALK